MSRFTINGIDLEIPGECLSPQISEALRSGKYEHSEAAALRRHLLPDDRMVDLGAGAGYLVSSAAKVVGGENVLGVEANPLMAAAARANLRRNGGGGGQVLHGAVVADAYTGETIRFLARRPFWGGHIDAGAADSDRHVDVPALRIGQVMAAHEPTLVMMDIEGGEADLAGYRWPGHVRMVILEIHARRYSAAVLNSIFTGFFDAGFTYSPWGSKAQTLIFARVDTALG